MLGWIHEKMANPKLAPGGGKFLPLVQPPLETAPQLAMTRAFQVGSVQPSLGMVFGTTHIHLTCLVGVRGWAESQIPWCNAHNI
jgi:hypothetical protein